MAVTELADVIVPDFYAAYGGINSMSSTALFQSGALVGNPLVESQLFAGGDILNVPAWNDIGTAIDAGGQEPNLSNDNPATVATPQKITAVNQLVRKSFLNMGFSAADFAAALAGSDPIQRVAERIQAAWARQYEFRLVQSLRGVLLSNVANSSSDMVTDISAATSGAPVTINGTAYSSPNISRNAVIDAVTSIGDRFQDFKAIVTPLRLVPRYPMAALTGSCKAPLTLSLHCLRL